MSMEEIKNCTLENAWELVEFAESEGVQIQGQDVADLYDHIYDLKDDADKDSIAETIDDILKCSDITVVYDYIKQAVEGNTRFVWEVNGFLVPFTENDLEKLKTVVLESIDHGA